MGSLMYEFASTNQSVSNNQQRKKISLFCFHFDICLRKMHIKCKRE